MSNPGPVFSAGSTQRVADAVPIVNMRSSILGWFRPITVGLTQQSVGDDGMVKLTVREVATSGVLQPLGEKLDRKSEGGRSWSHWELHCLPNLVLNTNDRITVKGSYYTVMEMMDYSSEGFVIYKLAKAPQTHGQ